MIERYGRAWLLAGSLVAALSAIPAMAQPVGRDPAAEREGQRACIGSSASWSNNSSSTSFGASFTFFEWRSRSSAQPCSMARSPA